MVDELAAYSMEERIRQDQAEIVRLREENQRLREENQRLRDAVEGRWFPDAYDQDGEPVLPRGWTIIDGGRLDELERQP